MLNGYDAYGYEHPGDDWDAEAAFEAAYESLQLSDSTAFSLAVMVKKWLVLCLEKAERAQRAEEQRKLQQDDDSIEVNEDDEVGQGAGKRQIRWAASDIGILPPGSGCMFIKIYYFPKLAHQLNFNFF